MSCDRIRPQLTAYLDGELADERGSVVRGHLRGCAACRAAATDEASLRDGLRSLSPVDPPASLWAGVQQRLAAEEVRDAKRPRWRLALARWLPSPRQLAIGGLVAAAAATLIVVRARRQHDDDSPRVSAPTSIAPVVIAPDGSGGARPLDRDEPAVAQAAPEATVDEDVSATLAAEPARVTTDYASAARELEAVAREARTRWAADQQQTFDDELAVLHKAIAGAPSERARQRGYRSLIRYLQRAAIRDEVVLASVDRTLPRGGTQ